MINLKYIKIKNKILLILIGIFVFIFSFNIKEIFAQREIITDWYVQNFDTTLTLNKDSSLDVVEKITADCGNLEDKHGIFRILPEETKIETGETTKTPIKLISITDFQGNPYKYEIILENNTITWKIGDPNKTVKGVNNYLIHYSVGNVIRFENQSFDEFYWNVLGNFWDLEIDNFHAKLIFPEGVTKDNIAIDYYTGDLGSKDKSLAKYSWTSQNVLEFYSTQPFKKHQGITVSLVFPKGIFTPYHFSFLELYGEYLYFIIPLVIFIICFNIFRKNGKYSSKNKTVIPIYEVPGGLSPLEIGVLMNGGKGNKEEFITAEIINLAVKGLITIKEVENKFMFLNKKDYLLIRKNNEEEEKNLTPAQKFILEKIFKDGSEIKLSSLKFPYTQKIDNLTINFLSKKKLLIKKRLNLASIFTVGGTILFFISFFTMVISFLLFLSITISAIIIFIFGLLINPYTQKGAETNWQIKGFKLFMKTVDKDRAKFYEKENIFEKFLPYAIVFGITDIWIKKMKEIYKEEYFANYIPMWYIGAGSNYTFNIDKFSSDIASLSSAISNNISLSSGVSGGSGFSGSGGGGSAGGGSGGGGGGGW